MSPPASSSRSFIAIGLVSVLGVVSLQQQDATGAGAGTLGVALAAIKDWTFLLGPGFIVGIGNGMLLGYLMYRSGLVPRRMAMLGLVGGPLICLSGILVLVGVIEQGGAAQGIATVPEFVWELSTRHLAHRQGIQRLADPAAGGRSRPARRPERRGARRRRLTAGQRPVAAAPSARGSEPASNEPSAATSIACEWPARPLPAGIATGAAPQSVKALQAESNPSSTRDREAGNLLADDEARRRHRGLRARRRPAAAAAAARGSGAGRGRPSCRPPSAPVRPRSAISGISVCSGRLPGAGAFGLAGIGREAGAAVVQQDARSAARARPTRTRSRCSGSARRAGPAVGGDERDRVARRPRPRRRHAGRPDRLRPPAPRGVRSESSSSTPTRIAAGSARWRSRSAAAPAKIAASSGAPCPNGSRSRVALGRRP